MQPLDKSKNNKVHRFCCSNPNCKKVFSKPKIIKYYVCPACQTIVDVTFENSQLIAQKKPVLEKKQVTLRKQKEIKQDENQESKAITSQQATTDNELKSQEKAEVKEIVETVEPTQMDEPNIVEITVNKKSDEMGSHYALPFSLSTSGEQLETVKEKTSKSSDFQCQYYFGYLSQKNKEEAIPEICFGCLKSIECMMSEYNKSKEAVQEIKKWYSFKL